MSVLEKFRKGAQKAGIQASAFMQASTTKVASGSRDFAQTFSLPGEAEKAAMILDSFLGKLANLVFSLYTTLLTYLIADPERPQSALNAIPKAVLQRARGIYIIFHFPFTAT